MFRLVLKTLRENSGLSQSEFAKKIGVAQSTIGMWESGKREPNFTTLTQIATIFNVPTDYLLGLSNETDASTSAEVTPREVTLKDFLEQNGITGEENVELLKPILELMRKNAHNEEISSDFNNKEYNTKQNA